MLSSGDSTMVNVFDYTDFRSYLSAWYEDKKGDNYRFSFQMIAQKAGIKNKGFIYNIIKGNKQLSKTNIFKLSKALGHNPSEAEYFETLVSFNQACDPSEKRYLFERMSRITNKGKKVSKAQVLRANQYEFYSNWWHVMVRSIIGLYGFKDDYKWLAKMVDPPLTIPQAKQSVRLLTKLELIRKDPAGIYRISSTKLTTGHDELSVAFQKFHLSCTDLAKRALEECATDKRNVSGLTLGMSEKSYEKICAEIIRFQDTIMDIANEDKSADRVYQLNFQLFPTSASDAERKKI